MNQGFSYSLNITSNMKEVLANKEASVLKALESIGLTAEAFAKMECPVDTGNLRNSITHETDKATVVVGTNVEYGKFVELGTYKMTPQPFLRPAFENHMAQYQNIFETCLKE